MQRKKGVDRGMNEKMNESLSVTIFSADGEQFLIKMQESHLRQDEIDTVVSHPEGIEYLHGNLDCCGEMPFGEPT